MAETPVDRGPENASDSSGLLRTHVVLEPDKDLTFDVTDGSLGSGRGGSAQSPSGRGAGGRTTTLGWAGPRCIDSEKDRETQERDDRHIPVALSNHAHIKASPPAKEGAARFLIVGVSK